MKKLLNDLALKTRTEYADYGDLISEIGHIDFYGKYHPAVYYEKGISEVDNLFGSTPYFKQGYVSYLIRQENCFSLIFMKWDDERPIDIGGLYISKDDIIDFQEFDADNLNVLEPHEIKERMNYMLKKGGGIVGALTGGLTDKLIPVNTHSVKGSKYILSYYDNSNQKRDIVLYSSDDYFQDVYLFIKTYYKKELPKEALSNSKTSNSNCFIATACYKDSFCEEVIFFRKYRDLKLDKSFLGRLFIALYYKFTPYIYKFLFKKPKITKHIKLILDKLYIILKD
jgi:hypothetical protein